MEFNLSGNWFMSHFPLESILGPAVCNIFINDVDEGVGRTNSKFADCTKLEEGVDFPV